MQPARLVRVLRSPCAHRDRQTPTLWIPPVMSLRHPGYPVTGLCILFSGCHTHTHTRVLSLSQSLDLVVSLAVSLDLRGPPVAVSLTEMHTHIHTRLKATSVPGSPSHASCSLRSSAWCLRAITRWHTNPRGVHAAWSLQLLAPQTHSPSVTDGVTEVPLTDPVPHTTLWDFFSRNLTDT